MRATRLVFPAGALLLGILLTGCSVAGSMPYYSTPAEGPAYVEIENHNWADVSVFVVRYGDWRRLGTVTSMTAARFRLPQAWVDRAEPVAIRVEPIGTNEFFVSRDVPLEWGVTLRVSVQNRLNHSTLVIR